MIEQAVSYDVSSNYNGFFVQDDWRVSQKLTLNLGLRYELESGVRESNGQIVTGLDTTTASPLRAAVLANYNANVPRRNSDCGVSNAAFNTLVVPGFGNNYTIGSQNTLRSLPYTLNNFRNQPFQKFDVGLTKNFNIREKMKLQIRVEAINALN